MAAAMNDGNETANIEFGMKASVWRSGRDRIGVVTGFRGDYINVWWTNSDLIDKRELADNPLT
jgi:hypothetical protein